MLNTADVKLVLEAALLSSQQPLTLAELRKLFEEDVGPDTLRRLLDELRGDWNGRAVKHIEAPLSFALLPWLMSTAKVRLPESGQGQSRSRSAVSLGMAMTRFLSQRVLSSRQPKWNQSSKIL